ncbi:hypothetical protein VKS41_006671 [Umbelopsis sp. WA50703]
MASKRNVSRFEKKYTNGGSHFDSTPARGMTPLRSYLLLGTYLIAAIILGSSLHYQLPEPKTHRGISPLVDAGEFSEYNAIETLTYLGDTLGYRIVGTIEEAQSADYLLQKIESYKQFSRGIPQAPKFDVWVQHQNGSHRFDIMDHMVLKMYTNVTNIIVRLSCPETPANESRDCDQNAVLLNAHFDTTLGSPGASDDGSGISVMLEIIRIMSQKSWDGYKNSMVFLFNGAEESLQDASHAFITMHEIKDSIRAVVNVDSCGTTGREILFQANSREMIDAYKQAPYPHGTVMANDVFSTGLILSDTDFRQFVEYGDNLIGIDMALYKNSYLYHTHLDTPKHLQPGSIQHLGENVLAIVEYLAKNTTLTGLERTNQVVYFDFYGKFFLVYSWATAFVVQMSTVVATGCFFAYILYRSTNTAPYRSIGQTLLAYLVSTASVLIGFVSAVAAPNIVAIILTSGLVNRPMSWFRNEAYGGIIFGPAALVAIFSTQYVSKLLPITGHPDPEHAGFVSCLMAFTFVSMITTLTGVASSYIFFVFNLFLLIAAIVNEAVLAPSSTKSVDKNGSRNGHLSHWTYLISVFPLSFIYIDYVFSLIDIFVPLTGRMGIDTPVDNIVAFIFGMVTFMLTTPFQAHAHKYGKKVLAKVIGLLFVFQLAVITSVIYSGASYGGWAFPYDELHPKRLFVQNLKNITSGESSIIVAEADKAAYTLPIIHKLEEAFDVPAEVRVGSLHAAEWDSVYPFSAFLGGYRFDTNNYIKSHTSNSSLAASSEPIGFQLVGKIPSVKSFDSVYDHSTGIRSFSVVAIAPTYTWTVISFDAHVLSWSIGDTEPLNHTSHYVVRHVGGYGSDGWRLDLKVLVPEDIRAQGEEAAKAWTMRAEFTALEKEGFAHRGEERLVGGVGMLSEVQKLLPIWTSTTWFGSVVGVWDL